jgi:hypothetical protein
MRLVGLKCLRVIGDTGGRNMSSIEDIVINKIVARAEIGERKYNTTMERVDLSRKAWLIHAQEEALDLAIYLQKLILLEDE